MSEKSKDSAEQLRRWLLDRSDLLASWIPRTSDLTARDLIRCAVMAYRTDSFGKLREAVEGRPGSLMLSLVTAGVLGLQPYGPLGEAHLVPRKGSVHLMPGYKGLIKLALEGGAVLAARAQVVHDGDTFELDLGDRERGIVHKVAVRDRGEPVGVYAIFTTPQGPEYEWIEWAEIMKIRKSAGKGPWDYWPTEMARKTVLKRGLKQFPLGYRFNQAVAVDNALETGTEDKIREVVSVTEDGEEIDIEIPDETIDGGDPEDGDEPSTAAGRLRQKAAKVAAVRRGE